MLVVLRIKHTRHTYLIGNLLETRQWAKRYHRGEHGG